MKLTTQQVAEKLGVSTVTVATLAREGKLPTANKQEPGKRVAHRFDSKVVAEFKKTYVAHARRNGKANGHATATAPGLLTLMVKRLAAMDDKLDRLIGMWS